MNLCTYSNCRLSVTSSNDINHSLVAILAVIMFPVAPLHLLVPMLGLFVTLHVLVQRGHQGVLRILDDFGERWERRSDQAIMR